MTAPEDRGEDAPWWVTAIILTVCVIGCLAWLTLATLWLWPATVRLVVEHTGAVLWTVAAVSAALLVWGLARQERGLAAETARVRAELSRSDR